MRKKLLFLILILLTLPLLGAGCINIGLKSGDDGGVFKSMDKAETWQQSVFVRQIKKNKIESIAHINVYKMYFDPQDNNTIYLATNGEGMYVTYNAGEKWDYIFTNKGEIEDIAIDPQSRNIIYTAIGNRIFKTTDAGQNWQQIYLETQPSRVINCLAVDSYETDRIYAGISDGRLIRSLDGGVSWKLVKDFENNLSQILINENNTWIVYVATLGKGIFRTDNFGETWQNITSREREDLRDYSGIEEFKFVVFDKTLSDSLLIATKYGLLKSNDGGKSWKSFKLLSLPGTTDILSLAINSQNNQEIYYGTTNALYKTVDGGKNWVTKSLPSSRAAKYLLVDPEVSDLIYLGVMKIQGEKKGLF